MPEAYNPIVRTFGQFRAGLLNRLDIARHEVRPETPLETLLPVGGWREVWNQLRRQDYGCLPSCSRSEIIGATCCTC
jgi:hypothetical protein